MHNYWGEIKAVQLKIKFLNKKKKLKIKIK